MPRSESAIVDCGEGRERRHVLPDSRDSRSDDDPEPGRRDGDSGQELTEQRTPGCARTRRRDSRHLTPSWYPPHTGGRVRPPS